MQIYDPGFTIAQQVVQYASYLDADLHPNCEVLIVPNSKTKPTKCEGSIANSRVGFRVKETRKTFVRTQVATPFNRK